MYVIKRDGRYLCHKGHYSVGNFYDSDDINEARVFKTPAGCKSSRFYIMKKNPEWLAWKEGGRIGPGPEYYLKELKDGYSIVKVTIVEAE